MNVEMIEEHDDGSATFTFELNWEERNILLNLGIITAIKNGIEEGAKYVGDTSLGNPECGTSDSVHGEGEQPRESEQP
jgi:hypothetical protein